MEEHKEESVESAKNISDSWLQNIYENLKNLEYMERLAREGCASVFDYAQIPIRMREMFIVDVQYKNLTLMANEFSLLLTDIGPICKKEFKNKLISKIDLIIERVKYKKDFVYAPVNTKGRVIHSRLLKPFFITLQILTETRREIINEIAPSLFVGKQLKEVGKGIVS